MTHTTSSLLTQPSMAFLLLTVAILLTQLIRPVRADDWFDTHCPPLGTPYPYFTPWFLPPFRDYFPSTNPLRCWDYSSCLFMQASEPGKQQFAATALVMGFIPITLKDFPWKRDSPVYVSRKLRRPLDVLVRTLGAMPKVPEGDERTIAAVVRGTKISFYAEKENRWRTVLAIVGCSVGLFVGYAGLAITETFSKRSALGCIYPIFILTWWIIAIIPAYVESLYQSHKRRQHKKANGKEGEGRDEDPGKETEDSVGSALVQFGWAVYDISGTLVYTAIMAVTVLELFTWLMLSLAVAAFGKALAFFICVLLEKPVSQGQHVPLLNEGLGTQNVETKGARD